MTPNFIEWAKSLLVDWENVRTCRPLTDLESSVDIECLRESIDEWATLLRRYSFDKESSSDLAETCYQFESRLEKYKKRIVIETLHHGTIH